MTQPQAFSARLTAPDTRLAGSVIAVRALAAVMLILMLGACSSGSDHTAAAPTVPPSSVPAPTTGGTGSGSGCTQADLLGPALPMPAPRRVAVPIALGGDNKARLEPAPGANPRVSAAQAWQKITALNPQRARSGELLLGTFTASFPFGPHGAEQEHLLAWVLRVHHLAYEHPSTSDPNSVGLAQPLSRCEFVDGFLVVDATTGNRVVNSY